MSGWLKEDAKNQCLSQNKSNFACRVDKVDFVIIFKNPSARNFGCI